MDGSAVDRPANRLTSSETPKTLLSMALPSSVSLPGECNGNEQTRRIGTDRDDLRLAPDVVRRPDTSTTNRTAYVNASSCRSFFSAETGMAARAWTFDVPSPPRRRPDPVCESGP